uniref:glucan endo-1,3-beta-D-glucosidase n=1 Tax=Davidia involucrata TaxID=16924 RepID=A0A5B6YRB0_DAVIN
MARAMVLIWACSVLLVTAKFSEGALNGLGVNWGSQASHNLHPNIVAQLLKDNGISKVKLFDSDSWTVKAFAGTGIEVMLGIPNNQLKQFSDSLDHAKDWVKDNVTKHLYDGGVDIKYVAVGNEPFLKSYNGSFLKTTLPAIENVQKAINDAGLRDKIKVTTPLNADVYDTTTGNPSGGEFRPDMKDLMVKIVKFLQANNAPFLVNIYPFLSLYLNPDFPVDFAFFDGGSKPVDDKGHQYTTMLDANLDTLVYALKKAGVPNLKIVVGEIGWPTDGDKNANVKLAKRFYDGFLKKMASNKPGTPLRPGHYDAYLFSLLDEDQKSIAPGDFERHWGILRFDGQPKFAMDFSGQGHDKLPVGAKGVQYLPSQWCVFNKDIKNMSLVPANINYACAQSDCTSLKYGSSCNNLDQYGNISYAFNMYYQTNDQDVEACNFNGLATVVKQNASQGTCLFLLQIVSAGKRLDVVFGRSVFAGLLILFALF